METMRPPHHWRRSRFSFVGKDQVDSDSHSNSKDILIQPFHCWTAPKSLQAVGLARSGNDGHSTCVGPQSRLLFPERRRGEDHPLCKGSLAPQGMELLHPLPKSREAPSSSLDLREGHRPVHYNRIIEFFMLTRRLIDPFPCPSPQMIASSHSCLSRSSSSCPPFATSLRRGRHALPPASSTLPGARPHSIVHITNHPFSPPPPSTPLLPVVNRRGGKRL